MKHLKILVVDDEEYNRLLFKAILNRWKLEYSVAADGMEALEMLKSDRYNMLFMDVRMPGIDGLKTTQLIRDVLNIDKSVMPVICISAVSMNEEWDKYRMAGINAFLQKPFTEEMLMTIILSVLKENTPVTIQGDFIKEEKRNSGPDKINLNNLFHIAGGDEQFVKQMLLTFIDTTDKGLNNMQNLATLGQWDEVASLSHKLLPPCRHIGAMHLYSLLQKIEEIIHNKNDTKIIESLTSESAREFRAVSELIKEHIAKIT
jgi:CheY-like chemotaxis protein